jgi:hypothetical protein
MGLEAFALTSLAGAPTLEFSILTANIGGQDYIRPRNPDNPSQWLLQQIYEYEVWKYDEETGDYTTLVSRQRKNTICTIDDTRRGRVFPCLQQHGARFGCGSQPGSQGVSRGWADDYFRGLRGQFAVIGATVGDFLVIAHLDPDNDLQREDLADSGRDADPDNNYAYVYLSLDGSGGTATVVLSFDPAEICPPSGDDPTYQQIYELPVTFNY